MWLLVAVPIIGLTMFFSFLLGKIESERMQKIAKTVFTVIASLLVVFSLIFLFFFSVLDSALSEPPTVKKQINEQYYFTQQEYGWVASMPGKHVFIYQDGFWFFDKEVGYIDKYLDTEELTIELEPISENKVNLLLFSGQTLEMDTVIDLEHQYLKIDQAYWYKHEK
jgi:hypothetical protein